MQKLSSQATGQSRGPSGSNTSTWIFRANMLDILVLLDHAFSVQPPGIVP
jgi:hypothetical protein